MLRYFIFIAILLGFSSCKNEQYTWQTIEVTATAYNSLAYQTSSQPNITAFGDSLKPGMKCIAVSRDLLTRGLDYNSPVKIEGLDGLYFVKDKMNKRWKNRIDIYMDEDVKKARKWGKQKINISFRVPLKKPDN